MAWAVTDQERVTMAAVLATSTIGSGRRIALLHGFTQNGRCWSTVDTALAESHEVVRVDLPGHGSSSRLTADLDGAARMAVDAIGPATWLGYSLGGRVALHVALACAEAVDRLVLVGATGGLRSSTERAARIAADESLAASIETDGVETFVRRWLDGPLFTSLSGEAAALDERLTNTAEGLASSLRLCGAGTQRPLWDDLDAIDAPVLVVAGEQDGKFTALGEELVSSIGGNAKLAVVPDAGHAAHLEQPSAFVATVIDWLGD